MKDISIRLRRTIKLPNSHIKPTERELPMSDKNNREISGTLFSAMLFALDAFMGKDGVISILKFAKLDTEELINLYNANYPANRNIGLDHFSKFIKAFWITGHIAYRPPNLFEYIYSGWKVGVKRTRDASGLTI